MRTLSAGRPTRIGLGAVLLATLLSAPVHAQQSSGGDEPSRLLLGLAAGPGVGGLLAGVLSTQALAVDVAALAGVRIRPGISLVAEVGMLPTTLESPFEERDLRPWRMMLGVQQPSGGWFRPTVGWEQGGWSAPEDPGTADDDSAGGPAVGLAGGTDIHQLGGGWELGLEGFARLAWLRTDPSITLRVFGVRGVILRR